MSWLFRYVARRLAWLVLVPSFIGLAATGGAHAQTLDKVRERGHLICAATNAMAGFAQRDNGLWSGFDVDFCRAVAAAVFGDPDRVQFQALSGEARFALLQTGAVDLIARNAPWTLLRDSRYGAHYVATSFYDGLAFMVPQSLGVVSAYELSDVSVCLTDHEDERRKVSDFFFENQINYDEVFYEDREDLRVAYATGACDAVVGPATWLHATRKTLDQPTQHRILPERISKEPLGPVVREGDDEWFNIVKWTLFAQIDAEELGITSQNIKPMLASRTPAVRRFLGIEADFGTALRLQPDWMRQVIAAVGNYGEMYDRNFGAQTGAPLLRGLNSLWTEGGLMYAPPIR